MQGLPVSFVAIIQEVTGESCFFISFLCLERISVAYLESFFDYEKN